MTSRDQFTADGFQKCGLCPYLLDRHHLKRYVTDGPVVALCENLNQTSNITDQNVLVPLLDGVPS